MAGKRKRDDIHLTPDVSYITNPDVAHEETDVPVGPVAKFVAGLAVFGAVVCLAMLLLFNFFEARAERDELEASPLARQGADRLPPEPRLQLAPGFGVTTEEGRRVDLSQTGTRGGVQPAPQSEYWTVRDQWDRDLNNYGWVSREAGTVHLPIKDAMRLYVERQQQAAPAAGSPSPQQQRQGPQPSGSPQQQPGAALPHGEQMPAASGSGHAPEQRHP